jgi:hypothetical protein
MFGRHVLTSLWTRKPARLGPLETISNVMSSALDIYKPYFAKAQFDLI